MKMEIAGVIYEVRACHVIVLPHIPELPIYLN